MGRESPRKEVISPMGQHGRNDSQKAHGHGKKRSNRSKSPTGWMDKGFCQGNVQAREEIREGSTSSRAHALHAMEDKHKHKRHVAK